MNDITYAGKLQKSEQIAPQKNKNWAIIYTLDNGAITHQKIEYRFHTKSIIVIPPLNEYLLICKDAHVVLIDMPLLPFKSITILKDNSQGMLEILFYRAQREEQKSKVLSALGSLIVAYICEMGQDTYSPTVQKILSDIEKNLSNTYYSLEDFLKRLPLNYDYARKLFKKEVGITPLEYLTKRRMELAKNIIYSKISNSYTNYSIAQIAESCGYLDPLYFSKVFKKHYGVSPSEYRANF